MTALDNMKPKFEVTTDLASAFGEANPEYADVCQQIAYRLGELSAMFARCLTLNDQYLTENRLRITPSFNEETGEMQISMGGMPAYSFKLNRANPDVPVKIADQTQVAAFIPGAANPKTDNKARLQGQLSREVESYYYFASLTWDILEKELIGKGNSKFIGVKMVRNNLLEHAYKGEKNELGSFAASEPNGPQVKNWRHSTSTHLPHDPGLVPNTTEFLEAVERRFLALAKSEIS